MANLNQSQIDQLYLVMVLCGGVSFVFSFIVLLAHIFLRKSQRRFNDPVLWLSICCLMMPVFTLKIGNWGTEWCVGEAAGNQFFNVASFLWVTCIAHQLYQVLCCDLPIISNKYLPAYHLLCWGIPLITVALLLFFGHFETETEDVGWCWIESGPWRFTLFYIPMFILMLINCAAYVFIIWTVYGKYKRALDVQGRGPESQSFAKQTLVWGLKASFYPLVFLGVTTGSTINRVYEIFSSNPNFGLKITHVLCSGLQGLFYALVYIYNERVLARLRRSCEPAAHGFESDYSYPYASSNYSEESEFDDSFPSESQDQYELRT
eukprot:CAMPEP_0184743706 /NCGR_PEP_ID=MMETSP0315-20130426/6546_1 /TAXON_ID=101924 /ORGANISM="Rhodosorus marinus, Strain UTEX LB 2760" /LENGTH=319 /DNA_ID=CAMNT_0027215115 /DNA_START=490 /DNA_END=1449 /DNA_ORIENTATION=+